jgi:hypothetical protein
MGENPLSRTGLAFELNEGWEMPDVDTAMGTLTVPIWAAGAVSAVFVVAIVLAMGKAGAVTAIATLFRVAVVLIGVSAGWIYLQRSSLQDRTVERRSLDERSAALMARAIAPGSALSCLDELAGEAVETACEKAVFASPEAVAAAVSYVTAKLALLADGTQHAQRVDTAYATDLVPLRAALELDRFGIVAHVLAQREGCTVDRCDALAQFHDPSHVRFNLLGNTFEDQVTKYTASWNAPPRPGAPEGPSIAGVAPALPVPTNPTPSPASVAPRYDFPSSQSIPPVNIMAAEPSAPRSQAVAPAPGAQPAAAVDPNGQAAITPVPPRRPPQVRVAPPPPRPSAARPDSGPLPPTAAGDPPADGAVPRPPPTPLAR